MMNKPISQTRAKDCENLPLHLAARYGCSMECMKILVDAYPESLGERNKHGETPFSDTFNEEVSPHKVFKNHFNLVH